MLVAAVATGLYAQSPQDVVEQCVAALGGESAVVKYKDYQAQGQAKLSMYGREFTGSVEIIEQGRNKRLKTELAFGKDTFVIINAYDGETAFQDRQGRIIDKPALNYESDLDHTFAVLIDEGTVFAAGKSTEIGGRKVTGIEADLDGKKTTFFIDNDSHTVSEIVFEDMYFGENNTKELIEKRIRYADYRDVEGIPFPTRMTFYEKGEKQWEIELADVSFEPEVDAELFRRPEQGLDLRYSEERMD
jgi:hypothetical protein